MALYLMPSFIVDLQKHGDANFAKRVLLKVCDNDGRFQEDRKDHPYTGIENAWIRYVSEGRSAYRAIYIRKGEEIYWYRAGEHSVEDRLPGPPQLGGIALSGQDILRFSPRAGPSVPAVGFLRNQPDYTIYRTFIGRRLIPHKDIVLISPFLS
jgi:hypothetical protein